MKKLLVRFLITFFLSINLGVLLYVNSSFLSQFFSSTMVSLVFTLGATAGIFSFLVAPRLVNILSKENFLFLSLTTALLANLLLALADSGLSAALSFIVYTTFHALAYYCLDIFIEEDSLDNKTGEMRGLYLTFVNAGIILGPLLVALTASETAFQPIYLSGSVILSLTLLLSLSLLPKARKLYPILEPSFSFPIKIWWQTRSVRSATLARLILSIFFALMVIYTPIYLHDHIGFSWSEIGVIFTVMLLPFVLFEWPAGELADHFWGEKEMMSIGFFLMGSALLIMPFLGKSFGLWMVILFLSRVGASLVEVMTESYFFKKIKAHETGFLSIFRLVNPLSIIIGATLGAIVLHFFKFETLFFVSAFIVAWGLFESLYLKDTL
jgi:MFS family permease